MSNSAVARTLQTGHEPDFHECRSAYLELRDWQESVDELSRAHDPVLVERLELAAEAILAFLPVLKMRSAEEVPEDFDEHELVYPRRWALWSETVGAYDKAYLSGVTPSATHGVDHERLQREIERPSWTYDVTGWSYGRDADGRAVAVASDRHGRRHFVAMWSIDPAPRGLPDEAFIVADGDTGDRPCYIEYPDGSLGLLPRSAGSRFDGWNFGYGGGGPGALVDAIVDAYAASRRVEHSAVPWSWINDAVCHSSKASLKISVADISRRLGPSERREALDELTRETTAGPTTTGFPTTR